MKPNETGNFYGSTIRAETVDERDRDRDGPTIPKQTFSISEPTYNEVRENGTRIGIGEIFFVFN
jgi:hypothetical protein